MPLAIDHWHQALRLIGPHRAPQAVRDQVQSLAQRSTAALSTAMSGYLAAHAGEVIRVRELEFGFELDVGCDAHGAARALAARLARCLVDEIESGSARVHRFASEVDYLAHFIAARVQGDAHERWYFADFAGLAPLPPSGAIRTLFESRPELSWALFSQITAKDAASPWHLLDAADALRVLDVLLAQAPEGDELPQAALPAFLAARAAAPDAVTVLGLLARALRAGSPACRGLLAGALVAVLAPAFAPQGAAALRRTAGAAPGRLALPGPAAALLERLQPLGPAAGAAVRVLRPALPTGIPTAHDSQASLEWDCSTAGLALLLPELDALLDDDFVAALPALAADSARGAFALAVLASAAGAPGAATVWHDAAWRAFLDVPDPLGWHEFLAQLREQGDKLAARRAWARQTERQRRGSVVRWRDARRAEAPLGVRVVRGVDLASGLWCDAALAEAVPGAAQRRAWRAARQDHAALDPALAQTPADEAWTELIMALAQFVWRRVAWRVPGMLGSSLPYLRRNLLGGAGRLSVVDGDTWAWGAARAPLQALVSMTSLSTREQRWRGPPPRHYTLEWS